MTDPGTLDPWFLAYGWLGAAALLGFLWIEQRFRRDAGLADVGWAAAIGCLAVCYALLGTGASTQRWLIGAIGALWGGRLALYLLIDRCSGKPEDGRYQNLRARWGARADLHFAWFFQAQALLAVLFSTVFWLGSANPNGSISAVQIAGMAVFLGAWLGEVMADRQLAAFRARPETRCTTCRDGLWRFSRHPNYFFEWLIWCGIALVVLPAPHGAWALLAPVAMYGFVTRLTGIPYTEAQALRSRPDYATYQATTSAFFPWPPRAEEAS